MPNEISQIFQQTLTFFDKKTDLNILLIADNADYLNDIQQNFNNLNYQFYTSNIFNEIKYNQRYDIALLLLNQQDTEVCTQNIQRCRDLFANHTVVFVNNNLNVNLAEFGFSKFNQHFVKINQQDFSIYQFNLFDYKHLPDWFNSKFWANPELWDKFRW